LDFLILINNIRLIGFLTIATINTGAIDASQVLTFRSVVLKTSTLKQMGRLLI